MKEIHFNKPQSELATYRESLEAYFEDHPPATVNEAIAKIEELTGIQRGPTQVRKFLDSLGLPITLVLDNARYQKCKLVWAVAKSLNIEMLYLPSYSPNLNLIERLWKFVKKDVLYSKYYADFGSFSAAIADCLARTHNDIRTSILYSWALAMGPRHCPRTTRIYVVKELYSSPGG